MTVKELKEALFEKCPVEYKGMKFARITRISFELNGERFINTATLWTIVNKVDRKIKKAIQIGLETKGY